MNQSAGAMAILRWAAAAASDVKRLTRCTPSCIPLVYELATPAEEEYKGVQGSTEEPGAQRRKE